MNDITFDLVALIWVYLTHPNWFSLLWSFSNKFPQFSANHRSPCSDCMATWFIAKLRFFTFSSLLIRDLSFIKSRVAQGIYEGSPQNTCLIEGSEIKIMGASGGGSKKSFFLVSVCKSANCLQFL